MTNDNDTTFQELAEAVQEIDRLKAKLEQARKERDSFAREFGDGNLVLAMTNCQAAAKDLAEARAELDAPTQISGEQAVLARVISLVRVFPLGHTGHWDKEGTHGVNCPLCLKQHEAKRELLFALQEPAIPPTMKALQIEELKAELEQVRKQFGCCSVCGFVAWRDKDQRTEDCQYCKLKAENARLAAALNTLSEFEYKGKDWQGRKETALRDLLAPTVELLPRLRQCVLHKSTCESVASKRRRTGLPNNICTCGAIDLEYACDAEISRITALMEGKV